MDLLIHYGFEPGTFVGSAGAAATLHAAPAPVMGD